MVAPSTKAGYKRWLGCGLWGGWFVFGGKKKKALRRNLPEFGDGDEGDWRPGSVTQTFYLVVQSKMHPASVRRTGVRAQGQRPAESDTQDRTACLQVQLIPPIL